MIPVLLAFGVYKVTQIFKEFAIEKWLGRAPHMLTLSLVSLALAFGLAALVFSGKALLIMGLAIAGMAALIHHVSSVLSWESEDKKISALLASHERRR